MNWGKRWCRDCVRVHVYAHVRWWLLAGSFHQRVLTFSLIGPQAECGITALFDIDLASLSHSHTHKHTFLSFSFFSPTQPWCFCIHVSWGLIHIFIDFSKCSCKYIFRLFLPKFQINGCRCVYKCDLVSFSIVKKWITYFTLLFNHLLVFRVTL